MFILLKLDVKLEMGLPSRNQQVFVIGLIIWITDAQVSLTTKSALVGEDSFVCGTQEVLICTIDNYLNTMTWAKDNFTGSIASCSPLSCTVLSSVASDYEFIYDTVGGIFNLTIKNVVLADSGIKYFCANGITSDNVTVDVKVSEDYTNAYKDIQHIGLNTTQLMITTGCIKIVTAEKVTFSWWFKQVNNNSQTHYLSNSEVRDDDSVCKADSNCGTSGFTRKTSSHNITEQETGTECIVGVVIHYGSRYRISNEFKSFRLASIVTDKNTTVTVTDEYSNIAVVKVVLCVLAALFGCVILLVICTLVVYCVVKRRRKAKRSKTGNVQETSSSSDKI